MNGQTLYTYILYRVPLMLMSSGDFHSQSSQRIRVGRQGDRHLAIVGNVFSAAIWKSSIRLTFGLLGHQYYISDAKDKI